MVTTLGVPGRVIEIRVLGVPPYKKSYKLKMVLKLAHLISSSVVCSPIAEARTWQFAARPRPVAKSLQWVVVYSRYHLQVTEIARRQHVRSRAYKNLYMIHRDRCLGRLTRPQARTQEAPGRSRMGVDYVERTSKSPAFDPHLPNLAINSFLVRRTAGPAWKLTFVSPESHSHCLSVSSRPAPMASRSCPASLPGNKSLQHLFKLPQSHC